MLTVDVHHHILPDFFWRETNEHRVIGGVAPPPWSKESALAFMDDAGIDVAPTSRICGATLRFGGHQELRRTTALSESERAAVLGENALSLLPRLASYRSPTSPAPARRRTSPESMTER